MNSFFTFFRSYGLVLVLLVCSPTALFAQTTGRGNFMTHPVNATLAVGNNPSGLVLGDVDGDGDPDLITANLNSNNVSVLLNDGTGSFPTSSTFAVGNGPQRLVLGDVDRDGDLDLVTANSGSSNVSVLLNNGTGSFPTNTTFAVGNAPRGIALSDLDGDGDLDLVAANTSSNNVSVLLNDGAGSFSPRTNFTVGASPQNVAPGDVDGDGDVDLVAVNYDSDNLSVLLNNGTGSFSTPTNFTVGNGPQSLALGDIDGDGDLDLVAGNASQNRASVLLNNGAGSFTNHPVNFLPIVGGTPRSVALGDVDSDGDLDLVTVASQTNIATVLLNDGTGNFILRPFNPSISVGAGVRGGFLGDLDTDGDLDLVAANGTDNNVSVFLNQPLPAINNLSVSPATACEGQSTTFTATVANLTGTYNFTLSNGINTPLVGNRTGPFIQTNTATGAVPQNFTLTISQISFSTTATISLTVNARPIPKLSASPNTTLTCAQTSLTLTATGGTSYTFAGSGIINQDMNAGIAVVNQPGTYSVTVANASGCTSTTSLIISSNLGGFPAAPALSASNSVVCAGSNMQVVATINGSPTGLQWYKNGQPVVGQTSAILTLGGVDAAQAGQYVLVLTGVCSVTSAPFSLTVNPTPVVTLLLLNNGAVLQATGGVLYERVCVIDRLNGYEIRQVDSSGTGFFTITRVGAYRLIVTGANGCQTVVESSIASLPR